eukprot:5593828-Prymnesium_polylepis.1
MTRAVTTALSEATSDSDWMTGRSAGQRPAHVNVCLPTMLAPVAILLLRLAGETREFTLARHASVLLWHGSTK